MPETLAARGWTTVRDSTDPRLVEAVEVTAEAEDEVPAGGTTSAAAVVIGIKPATKEAARIRAARRMGEVSGQIGLPYPVSPHFRTSGGAVTSSHSDL